MWIWSIYLHHTYLQYEFLVSSPEKKPAQEKYGLSPNSSFYIMSEIPEVTTSMLSDSKMLAMVSNYVHSTTWYHPETETLIKYLYFNPV